MIRCISMMRLAFLAFLISICSVGILSAQALRIATVNNGDMIVMKELSKDFEQKYNIPLEWIVLEENVLRQRVTTDISTDGGQFDIITIGAYEVPIWSKQGWLAALNMPNEYDTKDLLPAVRNISTYEGKLYAAPFYAESSMTFYNKELFSKAGISMKSAPKYRDIQKYAAKVHNPSSGIYGICLRGKAGWGENMAFITTLVNSYGGKWFDKNWKPQLNSSAWRRGVQFYVNLMQKYGPPGAVSNGFNENLALFASGKCGMWIDATVAAGFIADPKQSQVVDKFGWALAPYARTKKGANWFWSWNLAIPKSSKAVDNATKFIAWATSKEYIQMVGKARGQAQVPPGTRKSTYNSTYYKAAPFAEFVLKSIETANPSPSSRKPYFGIQFVAIPEFQGIATQVGQNLNDALAGNISVRNALKNSQSNAERVLDRAGYYR